MQNRLIGLASALAMASLLGDGCGGGGGDGTGHGGSNAGGTATGGRASGGAASGGKSGGGGGSGGNASGGAQSGGKSGGGAASGGNASGGAQSGGRSGGGAGSGGSQAGGSGGSTTPGNCPNVSACGGELVGTWKVTSSCLNLSGDMDVSLSSLGCATVPVTGSLKVTGTWSATAKGTYTDDTTTTGSVTFPVDDSCLSISSVKVECNKISGVFTALGWSTSDCSKNASGKCTCSLTANQNGGLGIISPWASPSGTYKTSDAGLNIDDNVDYSYCVAGNTLTMTPTVASAKGTIILQKDGTSSGTGGAAGSGGAGAGGKGGSGGAGSGGATSNSGGTATGSGGKAGAGGATGGSTAGSTGSRPCDIYAAANNTCVAAHSTVRALFASYSGNLYQVRRASDSKTQDIGVDGPGGLADAAAQDTFCAGTSCVITKIYDQSGKGNFLEYQSADSSVGGKDSPASATNESLNVSGRKVYSLYMKPANAYWRDGSKSGVPTGSAPQGIYMVTSGKHYNSGCCFDYGNGPTSRTMSGGGTMDSLYFGNSTTWGSGNGSGPWVMADLEGGIYAQGSGGKNDKVLSLPHTYVTAVEKNNGTSEFALRGGDATTGNLSTFYKGSLPGGYSPMKKQGAIVLGSGGDCCYSNTNASQGTFYEGAIVAGYPSDATDDAIQANVVSAGYGK